VTEAARASPRAVFLAANPVAARDRAYGMRGMRELGMSVRRIAEIYEISTHNVRRILKKKYRE
jgi:hypothetical protein